MRTVLRWASIYLLLLVSLTALGYYNQSLNGKLQALLSRETDLGNKEARLMLQRYQLVSPLALRNWAEANGFIPMSLARWETRPPGEQGSLTPEERSTP
jgi:predicted aminopeptidase